MSNAPNFPPSLPITRANQIQKDFFPFAAFSADDPNNTAIPILKLLAPWIFDGTFSGIGTALTNAIVGNAAGLASGNPVLLAGQIGYETDTLSFKIGDGTTAYNSLTYFYRGLPVAGEPSLGTPHPHLYVIQNGGALSAATHDFDVSAQVPVGTKQIYVTCDAVSTAGGVKVSLQDTSGNEFSSCQSAGSNFHGNLGSFVALDSSYLFRIVISINAATTFILRMTDYFI
jgi:hypothetical protein